MSIMEALKKIDKIKSEIIREYEKHTGEKFHDLMDHNYCFRIASEWKEKQLNNNNEE